MKITLQEIFLAQKGNCFYCFKPMLNKGGNHRASYTKDHFYPKIRGNGLNNNLVLAHGKCNELKGHRNPTKPEQIRFKELYRKINSRKEKVKSFIKETLM